MSDDTTETSTNFVHAKVEEDLRTGRYSEVVTRFPPEPSGYLHIGHAKAIHADFGTAEKYGGQCHLRYDDTNPANESQEFVDSIQNDIRWLGYDWGEHLYFASDYFEQMFDCAMRLIRDGKAYVCTLTPEEFREYRGAPTRPGKESPHRERPVEESVDLFERMRAGEFEDGSYVVRAKIDMSSPNLHLRDPAIYRIKREHHHRHGDTWCVYPIYDFAHCLEDAIEGVTHSLCSLEFEVHRPLYDWILDQFDGFPSRPEQTEFARLNLSYTVMSKRKIAQLVDEGRVDGWDDPRLPTLAGLRRRGYTASSVRRFCEDIGLTKYDGLTDIARLEHAIRDELNASAARRMGVLRPLKVVIDNYQEGQEDVFEGLNIPDDEAAGTRQVPFSREIYVERDDFMEDAPKKFFRLSIGREVRLRYACLVTCTHVDKDPETGEVTCVHCSWDPETRGGSAPDGRRVKGTIHWVSALHAVPAKVRLYDRLFTVEQPENVEEGQSFLDHVNPDSLEEVDAMLEPTLADATAGETFQFERLGYFCVDNVDSRPDALVLNRTVALRESRPKKGA